jgi:hypothetical protein
MEAAGASNIPDFFLSMMQSMAQKDIIEMSLPFTQ